MFSVLKPDIIKDCIAIKPGTWELFPMVLDEGKSCSDSALTQ